MLNPLKSSLVLLFSIILLACSSNGDSQLPLTLKKIISGKPTPDLVVMFPGINSPGTDFTDHNFVQMFQQQYSSVDIILADTRFAYVAAGNIAERIQNEIIAPAIRQGYENIWLVGVSLGGLNSIIYEKTFAGNIKGIVLIAPYLGEKHDIEGLLLNKQPLVWSEKHEKSINKTVRLWRYLIAETRSKEHPKLFLAYGDSDRFNDTHRLLASLLNQGHVFTKQGGHNWIVWKKLWQTLLDNNVFSFKKDKHS